MQVVALAPAVSQERAGLVRRARLLAWGGNVWHLFEFAIALGAGLAASSVALVGFGFDSLIEAAAGLVVVWRLAAGRAHSDTAERRAQQLIAGSFFLLAAYVGTESLRTLAGGAHPGTSWIGVGLAAFTAPTMPLLALAKRRLGRRLGSAALIGESGQSLLCAYLSVALLAGLLLNALVGWWWADPAAALAIGAVATREGVQTWKGEGCCDVC